MTKVQFNGKKENILKNFWAPKIRVIEILEPSKVKICLGNCDTSVQLPYYVL